MTSPNRYYTRYYMAVGQSFAALWAAHMPLTLYCKSGNFHVMNAN